MTSLWYEILPVTLELDQVVWLRRREDGETHPWRIAHQAGMHPNDAVFAHVERLFGERFEPEASIIHSTSTGQQKNSDRASLQDEMTCPDCSMTKIQPEMGLERAGRIIYHVQWQHSQLPEMSSKAGI